MFCYFILFFLNAISVFINLFRLSITIDLQTIWEFLPNILEKYQITLVY